MNQGAYAVARAVAPRIHAHFTSHLDAVKGDRSKLATVPELADIEAMIDAAFWASLRREESYITKISLAYITPEQSADPLRLQRPLPLDAGALSRVAPAVERPGIHLGVAQTDGELRVWGMARAIPKYCFVAEVAEPGLIVIKHYRGPESAKFVNVAVLEGDQIKVVDEHASTMPDCPTLLTSLLGFESPDAGDGSMNVLVQLAVSMRAHRRGGVLIIVPAGASEWNESIVQPISYAIARSDSALATLLRQGPETRGRVWQDAVERGVEAVAGLTAVDGATIITPAYDVLAFGAKIARRRGQAQVEQITLTEPIEGNVAAVVNPAHLGGTRHLSAAQFVHDQRDAMALVASQDGRFTVFAWSTCGDDMVHAHRVETLLL